MAARRKGRGGLTTGEFAAATGYTIRSIERFVSEELIIPASRTDGGHARFSDEQVEAVRRWRRHSPYRDPIGADGKPIPKNPGRMHREAQIWARRWVLLRRIRSLKAGEKL
ncbi:MerR family transcriptional regulator [Methylobacterium gossipiicola]|uniref:MerR family transcriptional regulator n=1 Tax=Methylobacterium gossipiicola TaxID=582675 RepID=UPI000B81FD7E|nr:MerR family transcriptional regulator [Methylobacterium gossipiicola]